MGDRGIVYEIRHKQNTRLDESDKHINIRMNDCKNITGKNEKQTKYKTNMNQRRDVQLHACMQACMTVCM